MDREIAHGDWRQAISGRLAVTASGSAFTASPMILDLTKDC